jgi:hypothetical protein
MSVDTSKDSYCGLLSDQLFFGASLCRACGLDWAVCAGWACTGEQEHRFNRSQPRQKVDQQTLFH